MAKAPLDPLYKGRAFICYRDVNRAVERHRKLFGLRLLLKKAVKLENYHLSVEQLKELNLRLKYGELHYQCLRDNGRPGRPGGGDVCPSKICLRLSHDARTLVVCQSHAHEVLQSKTSEDLSDKQSQLAQYDFHSPEGNKNGQSVVSHTGQVFSLPLGTTCTPISSKCQEKLTMKIKKSHFSPNEMVVVGSARDAQEQLMRYSPLSSTPVDVRPESKPSQSLQTPVLASSPSEKSNLKQNASVSRIPDKPQVRTVLEAKMACEPKFNGSKNVEKSYKIQAKSLNKISVQNEKVIKPVHKTALLSTSSNEKTTHKDNGKVNDKNVLKHRNRLQTHSTGPNHSSRVKTKVKKKIKYISSTVPLDTELGLSAKQTLAQTVLLKLLRVSCQLPMVEFSHALETFETLTDALRLNRRIHLSLNSKEELSGSRGQQDSYDAEKFGPGSPGSEDLAGTQIDGSYDFLISPNDFSPVPGNASTSFLAGGSSSQL